MNLAGISGLAACELDVRGSARQTRAAETRSRLAGCILEHFEEPFRDWSAGGGLGVSFEATPRLATYVFEGWDRTLDHLVPLLFRSSFL